MHLKSAAFVALSFTTASAFAAGGTATYQLPWPIKGQVLEYRSCGCADACWTAQVRNAQTKAVLATLRCDCEHLHASTSAQPVEHQLPQACPAPDDKARFIDESMKRLLQAPGRGSN